MNRRLALLVGFGTLFVAPLALAQEVTIGYAGLPYKSSGESPNGIQVSDSVLLHTGVGVEGGYDTNVFYQDTNTHSSGIIRVLPYLQLTNAPRGGTVARQLSFEARVGMQYRRYQSDDPALNGFRNSWMPNGGLALSVGSAQLAFGFADVFAKLEDAPYNPPPLGGTVLPITRYNNQAAIDGRWSPGGGRLTAVLRYMNMVDVIEGTYSYASSLSNYLMLDAAWKWLPKTAIFLNAQQGYVFYLNDDAQVQGKVPSYPLRLTTGLRGLLTERLAAVLSLGYTNGFYSSGATTGGIWGSTYVELSGTYRPTLTSRIVLGYRHSFENTVIAPFSYNDSVYASYVQQIAGRFALDISGRYSRIEYEGFQPVPGGAFVPRTDNVIQVGATFDYFLRDWAYLGIGYSLLNNDSNYVQDGNSASYLKQLIMGRLGITY